MERTPELNIMCHNCLFYLDKVTGNRDCIAEIEPIWAYGKNIPSNEKEVCPNCIHYVARLVGNECPREHHRIFAAGNPSPIGFAEGTCLYEARDARHACLFKEKQK